MTTKLTTMKEKFSSCHLILKSFFYSKGAIFMQKFSDKVECIFFREKLFSDKKEIQRKKNSSILNTETEVESHHKIYMLLSNGWFFRASVRLTKRQGMHHNSCWSEN